MRKQNKIQEINQKNNLFYDRLTNVKGSLPGMKSLVRKSNTQSKYR